MSAQAASLPTIDVFSTEYASDPQAVLNQVRGDYSIVKSARGFEAISFDACQEILRHEALSPGMDELCRAAGINEGPVFDFYTVNVNNLDGPEHTRLRKVLVPYFTRSRMDSLRQTVRRWVGEWLDEDSSGGEVELIGSVARRLPAAMFCELIGVPTTDWREVGRLSEENLKIFYMDETLRDDIVCGFEESDQYLRDVLATKKGHPGDDLASGLMKAVERSELTVDEVVSLLFILLEGSTDTTQSQIGRLFVSLANHEDEYQVLKGSPDCVPTTVLEAARFAPGIWSFPRFAIDQGEVAGIKFDAGDVLHVNVIAGNWDPEVFPSPELFSVRRSFRKPPLNFGHGPHTCPGKPLALMEMEEALRAVLDRWSRFELIGEFESEGAPALLVARRILLRYDA
jgi:cytochrome P450